jgi:hypothetical protein
MLGFMVILKRRDDVDRTVIHKESKLRLTVRARNDGIGIGNMTGEKVRQKERVNMREKVSKQITMLQRKENRDMLGH